MSAHIELRRQPDGRVEVIAVVPAGCRRRGWVSADRRICAALTAAPNTTIADALELGLRVLGLDVRCVDARGEAVAGRYAEEDVEAARRGMGK